MPSGSIARQNLPRTSSESLIYLIRIYPCLRQSKRLCPVTGTRFQAQHRHHLIECQCVVRRECTSQGLELQANDRETILKQADESLTRLKTDRIDLLLLHRPNPDIPIEESLSAPGYS
ncbi:MAG: aldo/keto reductase, partial [Lentisphaerales bacterium]